MVLAKVRRLRAADIMSVLQDKRGFVLMGPKAQSAVVRIHCLDNNKVECKENLNFAGDGFCSVDSIR